MSYVDLEFFRRLKRMRQKALANADHEREIEDDSIGLSIDERNQRKVKRAAIFSDDNDDSIGLSIERSKRKLKRAKTIKAKKPKNEAEAEPDQIQSCDEVSHGLNIDNGVIGEIMCRASSWREIYALKCVSKQFANHPTYAADFLLQLRKKGNKEPNLLAGIFFHVKRQSDDNRTIYQARFIPMSKWSNKLDVDELKNRGLKSLKIRKFLPPDFEIQECRHGLLLCTRKAYRFPSEADQNHQIDGYFVCNPITRKHSWLPMPPESSHNYSQTAFMVDKENGHYQVVKLPSTYHHSDQNLVGYQESFIDVEVYSSLLRCWRTRKCRFVYDHHQWFHSSRFISTHHNYVMERPTVQIGNSIYWIDKRFGSETKIACFDIEKEMIEIINHPADCSEYSWVRSLCIGKYQGMLHYAIQCDYDHTILLWRLENGGWKFLKEIGCFRSGQVPIRSLRMLKEDNFELHALDQERIFLKNSWRIICYNFVSDMEETHMLFHADFISGNKAVMPYLLPKMPLPVF